MCYIFGIFERNIVRHILEISMAAFKELRKDLHAWSKLIFQVFTLVSYVCT